MEADKIIANRILGMVKTLNRLDGEMKSAEYQGRRRQFYMENMLLEALSMLSDMTGTNDRQFEDMLKAGGDLSKEAKKELYRFPAGRFRAGKENCVLKTAKTIF